MHRYSNTSCTDYLKFIAFEDNERSAVLSDGKNKMFYHVSMDPPNWYQWLDPDHPDDGSWQTVCKLNSCFYRLYSYVALCVHEHRLMCIYTVRMTIINMESTKH